MSYRDQTVRPLSGYLDFRSMPDQMSVGSFRFRQNFAANDEGKICRATGFSKLLSTGSNYGNVDFHDQLLPLQTYYDNKVPKPDGADEVDVYPNATLCGSILKTRSNGREPVTFIKELVKTDNIRRLVIGTQSKLAVLNLATRNYRIIADGFGGPPDAMLNRRWYGDALKNTAIFTNNFDAPVAWGMGGSTLSLPLAGTATTDTTRPLLDEPQGCGMQTVVTIPDLDVIKLTKAACVKAFGSLMVLANVEMDNQRFPNRVVWSDLNQPTSYDPAKPASITGFYTLDEGETIIEMIVFNSALFLFTNTGIWISSGGTTTALTFTRIYRGPHTLAYRNTLCSDGSFMYFVSREQVFRYNTFLVEPESPEWLNKGTGVLFESIDGYGKLNEACCNSHVAGFDENKNEIHISWAEAGSCVPSKTLVLNTKYEFVDTRDYGMTAYGHYRPDDRPSLRDFLLHNCSCNISQLALLGITFVKEAMPGTAFLLCENPLQSIYTKTTRIQFGTTTEDFSQAEADSDSLCAFLGGKISDDICGECNVKSVFIGAHSDDYCLKELGAVYSRELCTNADTPTGPGTPYTNVAGTYYSFEGEYDYEGYYSIMRAAGDAFGAVSVEKNLRRMLFELTAAEQATPCVLSFKVGKGYNAVDPNREGCGVVWNATTRKLLRCMNSLTVAQYVAQKLVPNKGIEFPQFCNGRFLYWELVIGTLTDQNNLDSALVPPMGGSSCFSSVTHTFKANSGIIK